MMRMTGAANLLAAFRIGQKGANQKKNHKKINKKKKKREREREREREKDEENEIGLFTPQLAY